MDKSVSLFNIKLKEAMKQNSTSQQKLASAIGTTQQTISRWLQGTNQPDIDALLFICYYFNISPNELLGWDDMQAEGIPYEQLYKENYSDKYDALSLLKSYHEYPKRQKDLDDLAKQMKNAKEKDLI